ncbi:MAG: TIGR03905 family protein [Elusimicrobia bacterium CG_4_10_14_0_2_um_filter_56_8]|nr:MAG: TIGR03905 family protein [Elusimicrobia bacterium CG1_02_56_21]PJA12065.1 MAG: TIGR03905 family protein [Elusimicrobia bacterium CG_4_10_14_0_2_um_filter_56_8]
MKYKLKDVCATEVEFDVVDGRLKNVSFSNGCSGNLKALSVLLEGASVEETVSKLKGITCGENSTSCSDQLAKVLEKIAKPGK